MWFLLLFLLVLFLARAMCLLHPAVCQPLSAPVCNLSPACLIPKPAQTPGQVCKRPYCRLRQREEISGPSQQHQQVNVSPAVQNIPGPPCQPAPMFPRPSVPKNPCSALLGCESWTSPESLSSGREVTPKLLLLIIQSPVLHFGMTLSFQNRPGEGRWGDPALS